MRRGLDGWRAAGREHLRLWQPQLPRLDDQLGLGFLGLMQLRLVQCLSGAPVRQMTA